MARRAKRVYVPLDAGFFDDDRIIEAGEKAAVLYLAMLCKAKLIDNDGAINRQQMSRIGVPGWQARVKRLLAVGLVHEDDLGYHIRTWTDWNPTKEERAAEREHERIRKAEQREAARKAAHLSLVEDA